jgi:hypothetical protein
VADIATGQQIDSLFFTPTRSASDGTEFTVSSSTWTTGGHPLVQTTFVGNHFGKALIITTGGGRGNVGGTRVELAPRLFLGNDAAGTEIDSPSLQVNGLSFPEGGVYVTHSRVWLKTGLVKGATYFVRLEHQQNGGTTGQITRRVLHAVGVN